MSRCGCYVSFVFVCLRRCVRVDVPVSLYPLTGHYMRTETNLSYSRAVFQALASLANSSATRILFLKFIGKQSSRGGWLVSSRSNARRGAACPLRYAGRCELCVAWSIVREVCCVLRRSTQWLRSTQQASCSREHATHNTQGPAYHNTEQTARSKRHAARSGYAVLRSGYAVATQWLRAAQYCVFLRAA